MVYCLNVNQAKRALDLKYVILGLLFGFVLDLGLLFDSSKLTPTLNSDPIDNFSSTYAANLSKTISIFCTVMTNKMPDYDSSYAKRSWLQRCSDYSIKAVNSVVQQPKFSTPRTSWIDIRRILRDLFIHHAEYDFYLEVGHLDYVVMENLRHALSKEDRGKPFLMGHMHEPGSKNGSISGSTGYVLSWSALKLIVERLATEKACVAKQNVAGDEQLGLCAKALGVEICDSLDIWGKSRFSNISIIDMVGPYKNNTPRWYPADTDYTLPKYDLKKLPASPELATIEGAKDGIDLLAFEYLIYRLRPNGIRHKWSAAVNQY